MPTEEWERDEGYNEMAKIMTDIAVVNDTAKRGVKDIEEYVNSAMDGAQCGRIILVAKSHRFRLPQFLKNEMENNI